MAQWSSPVLSAIEFFSGIGSFRVVAPEFGINVVTAYDQSEDANKVYHHNFGEQPRSRNLDTICGNELQPADLWWLSPSCKPFTRRGNRADASDPRAAALLNLVSLMPEMAPRYILLENVQGFAQSQVEALLLNSFDKLGYDFQCVDLCPTQMGIPMQRPRRFYLASADGFPSAQLQPRIESAPVSVGAFIRDSDSAKSNLQLERQLQLKFFDSLNIINPQNETATAICFTSGYGKSLKASGSYIELPNGALRRFSPEEIISLFGFPDSFSFPDCISLTSKWRLAGNAVDLRCIRAVLKMLLQ